MSVPRYAVTRRLGRASWRSSLRRAAPGENEEAGRFSHHLVELLHFVHQVIVLQPPSILKYTLQRGLSCSIHCPTQGSNINETTAVCVYFSKTLSQIFHIFRKYHLCSLLHEWCFCLFWSSSSPYWWTYWRATPRLTPRHRRVRACRRCCVLQRFNNNRNKRFFATK